MKSCRSLMLLAVAACLSWSPTPLARSVTGLLDIPHEDLSTGIVPHDDAYAIPDLSAVHGQAGLDRSGRQLNLFTAVAALTGLASSVLDAFIGVAAGAATDAIFGSQIVPVDLSQLINDALEEIDRIVGDNIAEAFNNFQQTQLNSLGRQVREYIRRNDLQDSRRIVQDMLTDASNLLAFFKENGVVTNSAFQTTLGLRLSLLLELLQLDQLIGESDAVLTRAEDNIRAQARDGRLALEQWAATFEPVTNDVSVRISRPCASLNPGGRCAARSTRLADITVCMDISSPRLEKPDRFCLPRQCSSNHIFLRVRNNRIDRCLQSTERSLSADVRTHADDVGIQQFRKRNEATIFGEGFRLFLARLQEAEDAAFVDVSTTESIPELPIEPVEE